MIISGIDAPTTLSLHHQPLTVTTTSKPRPAPADDGEPPSPPSSASKAKVAAKPKPAAKAEPKRKAEKTAAPKEKKSKVDETPKEKASVKAADSKSASSSKPADGGSAKAAKSSADNSSKHTAAGSQPASAAAQPAAPAGLPAKASVTTVDAALPADKQGPPRIVTQPFNQVVWSGPDSNAVLYCGVEGALPLTYQWYQVCLAKKGEGWVGLSLSPVIFFSHLSGNFFCLSLSRQFFGFFFFLGGCRAPSLCRTLAATGTV